MVNQPEETGLIQTWLAPLAGPAGLGLNDDAACLTPRPDHDLVITTDTVVAGVHFLADDDPFDIAIKAVTVNLSDLVAKGAEAVGYQVALSLPEKPGDSWMRAFAAGLAAQINGRLLGGDLTTSRGGPLTVTVTAIGEVPSGKMIRRDGANPGDRVYVAGAIGSAAAGLRLANGTDNALHDDDALAELLETYRAPVIYLPSETATLLRDHASAGLDISDGLAIDLQRLCSASGVSAIIDPDHIPLHPAVRNLIADGSFSLEEAITGGDDYLPLFTVPDPDKAAFESACGPLPVYCIGEIVSGNAPVTFRYKSGEILLLSGQSGYDHFSTS